MIRAADGWAPRPEGIPTAVDESIADARSKHRRDDIPVEEEDSQPDDRKRIDGGEAQD